jgi:CDP-glycerol glycerophosphotransferase (TagB/SpsB family)
LEIIEKWKSLNGKHFTFFDTTNLNPLFRKADIMFSDTTSAIQEFTLTQKPIVTFRHHRPNNYVINVTEADEIEKAFMYAFTHPPAIMQNLKAIAEAIHPYTDGKSSQRVIDAAISFLHKDKLHLKRKPLNLVRKYKVRKQLQYFTFKSYRKPFTKKEG